MICPTSFVNFTAVNVRIEQFRHGMVPISVPDCQEHMCNVAVSSWVDKDKCADGEVIMID